jgi:hypothetical protein
MDEFGRKDFYVQITLKAVKFVLFMVRRWKLVLKCGHVRIAFDEELESTIWCLKLYAVHTSLNKSKSIGYK